MLQSLESIVFKILKPSVEFTIGLQEKQKGQESKQQKNIIVKISGSCLVSTILYILNQVSNLEGSYTRNKKVNNGGSN